MWRVFLTGAWAVLTVLMSIGVPFIFYYNNQKEKAADEHILTLITQKIAENNDKYFEK